MAKDDFSLRALTDGLTASLTASLVRPTIYAYVPHSKQLLFHQSKKIGRLYIGGNRSGKTVGGITEDIYWLLGKHPYITTPPPPVRGRIVTVDYDNGWELIIKPILRAWLPPTALINGSWEDSWSEKRKLLTLANGSELDIMSYQQITSKQAGTSRHFIHFDEEPPSTLFNENMMRLMDTKGSWWITMTPVEGYTWTSDRLFEKAVGGDHPNIDVIKVKTKDNPYISEEAPSIYTEGMEESDKKAREEGEYFHHGGLIYKGFSHDIHVVPSFIPPREFQWIRSLDHGYNVATAWLYHAVAPDGTIITFYEHYRREWTIAQHANKLHEIDKELKKHPERSVGDPAIRQRMPNTGKSVHREYTELGIPIQVSNNNVKIGIDQVNTRINSAKWFITENCVNTIWEIKRYRWKTRANRKLQELHGDYDEPHKKDDHAMDSLRYLVINYPLPKLDKSLSTREKTRRRRIIVESYINPSTPINNRVGRLDTGLRRSYNNPRLVNESGDFGSHSIINTEWSGVIDDHLGGIF